MTHLNTRRDPARELQWVAALAAYETHKNTHKGGSTMRKITILAATVAALAVPAVASAHHTTGWQATCTDVTVGYVSTNGTVFSGTVSANNVPVASWNITAGQGHPVSGQLTVPYTAPAGPFTLTAAWVFSSGETGTLPAITLTCSSPPAPPTEAPVTPPAPAVAPPAPALIASVPVASATAPTVARKPHRKPAKRCAHGRRHLVFKHAPHKGQHFTLCRTPKPPIIVVPHFTG